MKKLSIISILTAFVCFSIGCKKEAEKTADFTLTSADQALLKINYNSGYANPKLDSIQLEVNGTRVSNMLRPRTPFPGGGYNTGGGSTPDYLPVNAGTLKLDVVKPFKGTNTDSVTLFSTDLSLSASKYYTLHITDTGANTKTVLIEDDRSLPDTGVAKHKFVNLMPDVPSIDLYYGTTKVASAIPYLGSSPYFTVPRVTNTNPLQTWAIREAGADPATAALATYSSSNTVLNRRIYTAFAVGYKAATDATRKPYISFLLNR